MKKLLFRIGLGLHEKLQTYAKENGISMAAALRIIISQFFKNKQ
jgi:hypothetical protein